MVTTKPLRKKNARALYTQPLFVVAAFALMVILSYVFMSNLVRGNLARNADNVLDSSETRVSLDLGSARSALTGFSETTRDMIVRGDSSDMLQEYIDNIPYYSSAVDSSAIEIKSYHGYFQAFPGESVLLQSGEQNLSEEQHPSETDTPETLPWYQEAVDSDGDMVETTPYINDANEAIFTCATCVLDNSGQRLGVVWIDVKINATGQEIVDTALNQGGYGMLMSQDLLILSHPNADFVGRYADDPAVPVSAFAEDLQNGSDISEQAMNSYRGEKSVVFFRKLSNGWYLGLVTPEDRFYQNITSMAVVLCLLGTALATALSVILVRVESARRRSDEASRQKSTFLANMSHEIRTPINAIVGMTAIGRTAGTTERKDYCFAKINNASKHLLGIINDILDISKIEANKIELSATDFNFERMLQQVVNVVSFQVDEKEQKLAVYIDKAIPSVLFADDQRFAQVITNLLSNAVKFTPEKGMLSLKTFLEDENDDVCTIRVEVTDTGIGISPEQQSKLFQSFQQAESSTTRKYGGTGLGLTISKHIVEMMDGKIWIESELGKGTTMKFTVKAKRGVDSLHSSALQGVSWKNVRILAVDDDPDVLVYFQEILSSLGAVCSVAAGAEEALRLVEQNGAYDIYFVDLKMPNMDGMALTKELKAMEEEHESSIVIMISSADLSTVENEAKKAGVDRFLLKPLFPSSVADAISEHIGIADKEEGVLQNIEGIFAGRHILFAEDIEVNREIVLTLLEPTLLEIDCAKNGVEAVKMFRESPEKYEMVYMDVQMPEMDGLEATRRIRALDVIHAKTVPIIAMTANVFREDVEKCLSAGMNGHLGKPLDMNDLLETTLKYLGKTTAN